MDIEWPFSTLVLYLSGKGDRGRDGLLREGVSGGDRGMQRGDFWRLHWIGTK